MIGHKMWDVLDTPTDCLANDLPERFGPVAYHWGGPNSLRKTARKKRARCAGRTKAGRRCKRMAVGPSKFCHLHKRKR
jgi:hypothetical protein